MFWGKLGTKTETSQKIKKKSKSFSWVRMFLYLLFFTTLNARLRVKYGICAFYMRIQISQIKLVCDLVWYQVKAPTTVIAPTTSVFFLFDYDDLKERS